MTDGEILANFNQAKDPTGQVKILAELNATSVANIKRILMDRGVAPERLPWGRQRMAPRRIAR